MSGRRLLSLNLSLCFANERCCAFLVRLTVMFSVLVDNYLFSQWLSGQLSKVTESENCRGVHVHLDMN